MSDHLGNNVIQGTGEVYFANTGVRPPPGINLPPHGEVDATYHTGVAADAAVPGGAPAHGDPIVAVTRVSPAALNSPHRLHVWEHGRWVDLSEGAQPILEHDVNATHTVGFQYEGALADPEPPHGWRIDAAEAPPANGKTFRLKASGWTNVGELAKAGIQFGAVPSTQMVYKANTFYAFDAHDVAVNDEFSMALLNASLENFYNLVLHQNIAAFKQGQTGAGGHTRNLRFRSDGGPERHKRGWAILHDGFGSGVRTDDGEVFRRRLWLPRVVNGGSAPMQMSDDAQQVLVCRFMVMQSGVEDTIINLTTDNKRYLNNEQPPIEYWEDL